ncbi:hypothetical protein [Sinorhizobium sp. 22678]|uniref:hypothetical protein n=1 Tax=Sinorhizobium sp. 22678 TaxID=3453955 RepID=UPI003F8787D0
MSERTPGTWRQDRDYPWIIVSDEFGQVMSAESEADAAYIVSLAAQNEWLKDRLAFLQLPAIRAGEREKWLVECGMPPAASSPSSAGGKDQ